MCSGYSGGYDCRKCCVRLEYSAAFILMRDYFFTRNIRYLVLDMYCIFPNVARYDNSITVVVAWMLMGLS